MRQKDRKHTSDCILCEQCMQVDGEWQLVFSRNSKGSPSLQKVFSFQKGYANFDVSKKVFHNIVQLAGTFLQVLADVVYTTTAEEPSRLQSTITMVS
jgi:hypothetical protein